jgi:glycerophosphoryl diester phosphodiesterase
VIWFEDLIHRRTPLVIAHRGASAVARENTLEAFERAIAMGADAIEFDVRRTADGVIVVHHDAGIAGTDTVIAQATLEEVRQAALSHGYRVPTLDETLRACARRIALDIELKEGGYERDISQAVREYYDLSGVVFKSFDDVSVARLKEAEPTAIVGLLIGQNRRMIWRDFFPGRRLRRCRADFVSPHWRLVRFGFVRRMRRMRMPVLVWTVDDALLAGILLKKGVAGIITNVPDRIRPAIVP